MFCVLRLAELGISDVAIVERNDRLGRKLSATGNGQGNVTNENMSAAHYFSSTGSAAGVLQNSGKNSFCGLWVIWADCSERTNGAGLSRVQAGFFRDGYSALCACRRGDKRSHKNKVTDIVSKKDGFTVTTEQGDLLADCVVLACGGKASPHFGTDGSGYELAKNSGIPVRRSILRWFS